MNLPNWITLLRILLIPFFVAVLLKYRQVCLPYLRYYAILIFSLAILTDALDGTIARMKHKKTQLGALLDPLADKLLLLSAVFLLSIPIRGLAQLPIWVLVTFISRDLMLIFGAVVVYMQNQKLTVRPNLLGKITTFTQMLTIIWILFLLPLPHIVWRIAGFCTILSGAIYLYKGSKQLSKA